MVKFLPCVRVSRTPTVRPSLSATAVPPSILREIATRVTLVTDPEARVTRNGSRLFPSPELVQVDVVALRPAVDLVAILAEVVGHEGHVALEADEHSLEVLLRGNHVAG